MGQNAFLRFSNSFKAFVTERTNFMVLYDVSCLYSDFVLPYVKNLDRTGTEQKSPKYHKLSRVKIKIVVTPFCKSECANILLKNGDVSSSGVGMLLTEKALESGDVFHVKSINDALINSKLLLDFQTSDGKREDAFHISTANHYSLPIVTSERKKKDLWCQYCKLPVVDHVDFWKFVDNCTSEHTRTEIKDLFDNLFPY